MNHIKEHQQYEKVRNCRRNACTDTAKARQPAMTINQKIIQNSIDVAVLPATSVKERSGIIREINTTATTMAKI